MEKVASGTTNSLFDKGRQVELYRVGERGAIKHLATAYHFYTDTLKYYKSYERAVREFELLTKTRVNKSS